MLKVIVIMFLSLWCWNRGVAERLQRDTESRYNSYGNYFYIQATRSSLINGASTIFDEPNKMNYFFYNIGDTVELTCNHYHNEDKTWQMQWIDNYSFGTSVYVLSVETVALRLLMKPVKDDNGMVLTCRRFGPIYTNNIPIDEAHNVKEISVALLAMSVSADAKDTGLINTQYIKKGKPLQNNATCNSTVQLFGSAPVALLPNRAITHAFQYKHNGLIASCIRYVDTGLNQTIQTIERRKLNTTVFYLESESDSSASVVGGILGGIITILIIMLVILTMLFWKKQSGSSGGTSDEVIYAEIEDRPPKIPPARQVQPSCKTVGTPAEKPEQPPEPLYLQINV